MLWRFGLQHASNIDKLLEKEDVTLEEVLNDPDLLQEVREQNQKVIMYLVIPQNLKQMVDYIASDEFFKFSKMATTACEVLCSNNMAFHEALISNYSLQNFEDDEPSDGDESNVYEEYADSTSSRSDAGDSSHNPNLGSNSNPNQNSNKTEPSSDHHTDIHADSKSSSSQSPVQDSPDQKGHIDSIDENSNNADNSDDLRENKQDIIEEEELRPYLLETLWGVMELNGGDLDIHQAANFSRIMCGLLQRKPYEALDFIRSRENAVALFLRHIGVTAVVDLLLKIISLEELGEGPGVVAWLSQNHLVTCLVDMLAPDRDPEIHSLATQVLLDIIAISQCNNPAQPTIGTNALIDELKSEPTVNRLADYMLDRKAPHATSTLINCVYIFIELIRRNYSESDTMIQTEDQTAYGFGDYEEGSYDHQSQAPRPMPVVDLSEMMKVLALRIENLVELLENPRASTTPVPTTLGPREPLGFERLRICELFAELLHCSSMPRLNVPIDEPLKDDERNDTASTEQPSHKDNPITHSQGECGSEDAPIATPKEHQDSPKDSDSIVETDREQTAEEDEDNNEEGYSSGIPLEISDPADHNTENTPVGQLLKWNLIRYRVLPVCVDMFFRFPLNNFLHSVVYDMMHQVLNLPLELECNVALVLAAFNDVRITSRIARACSENSKICEQPKGVRLGYMGHLTGIGEEVARLLELSGAALEPLISPYINGEEWMDYVARTLQEMRERDQHPLGGERPGVDMFDIDDSNQVFVSRMGIVDPATGETYAHEDDDIDIDDDEVNNTGIDNEAKHTGQTSAAEEVSGASDSSILAQAVLRPSDNDDEELDYINTTPDIYFGHKPNVSGSTDSGNTPSQFALHPSIDDDDPEQFIIQERGKASSDEDGDGGEEIGPAGRIDRYHSYQNEQRRFSGGFLMPACGDGDDGNDINAYDDEDEDYATEIGRMNDYMQSRAAELTDSARIHSNAKGNVTATDKRNAASPPSDDHEGKGGSLMYIDFVGDENVNDDNNNNNSSSSNSKSSSINDKDDCADCGFIPLSSNKAEGRDSKKTRRRLARLSLDDGAATATSIVAATPPVNQPVDAAPPFILDLPPLSSANKLLAQAAGASTKAKSQKLHLPTNSSTTAAPTIPTTTATQTTSATNFKIESTPQSTFRFSATTTNVAPFASTVPVPTTDTSTHPAGPTTTNRQDSPFPGIDPFPEPILNEYDEQVNEHPGTYTPSHSLRLGMLSDAKDGEAESSLLGEPRRRTFSSSDIENRRTNGNLSDSGGEPLPLHGGSKLRHSTVYSSSDTEALADDTRQDSLSSGKNDAGSDLEQSSSQSRSAGRRRRSRSQSAGVGISRSMVLQAASLGQMPAFDPSTFKFVGKIKGDAVSLNAGPPSAANHNSRQRSHTASALGHRPLTLGQPFSNNGGSPISSSPTAQSFNIPRVPQQKYQIHPLQPKSSGSHGSVPTSFSVPSVTFRPSSLPMASALKSFPIELPSDSESDGGSSEYDSDSDNTCGVSDDKTTSNGASTKTKGNGKDSGTRGAMEQEKTLAIDVNSCGNDSNGRVNGQASAINEKESSKRRDEQHNRVQAWDHSTSNTVGFW